MKKIEKLTLEQIEKLNFYKTKWLNKIFNYELYNSITKESVIIKMKELYKYCNLKEPIVIFVDSPYACQIVANFFIINQVENQIGDQVRDQVENQIGDQVWKQVSDQVMNRVGDQVRDQVENWVGNQIKDQVWNQVGNRIKDQVWDQVENRIGKQVGNQIGDQVWDQVVDQVWNQVDVQIRDQVGVQVENQVGNQVWNQINYIMFSTYVNHTDFSWLSFYDYFDKEFNLFSQLSKQFNSIISFVENSFMSIQLEKLCIVSRYPSFISRNTNNELHNINTAAIKFKDGYEQHYFNGIYISPELFKKLLNKEYCFEEWSKENNEEIKSLVLAFYEEKYGGEFVFRFLSKYLNEIDTYIDKKEQKHLEYTTKGMNLGVYTLFKGKINNINIAYVRCYCPSTNRMFFLGVHPDLTNAKDAISSLCQIPVKLKDHLISINRQGEIFSFNFDEIGTKMLKNNEITIDDLNNVVSLSGNEYFNKIKFEY